MRWTLFKIICSTEQFFKFLKVTVYIDSLKKAVPFPSNEINQTSILKIQIMHPGFLGVGEPGREA